MKVTRKLNWISSVKPENQSVLVDLQRRMAEFYAKSPDYYGAIDFTASNWLSNEFYCDIVQRLQTANSIVEVGCGSANILAHHPNLVDRYSGCDFSNALLDSNRSRYPNAQFREILEPSILPFESESADVVFSVFVIEHTIYPSKFLDECYRLLRPGGTFILLCPDFLGACRMTSQCAGTSFGNGRQKLAKGRVWDALLTGYDRKIGIPSYCRYLMRTIGEDFGFYVNLAPVCFEHPFLPDHDAIYLTYEKEIRGYLKGRVNFLTLNNESKEQQLIYMVGIKCG